MRGYSVNQRVKMLLLSITLIVQVQGQQLIKIEEVEFNSFPSLVKSQLEIITEVNGQYLLKAEKSVLNILDEKAFSYEIINPLGENYLKELASPVANAGIPVSLIAERGNQGSVNFWGWQQPVVFVGDYVGYLETNRPNKLDGFSFYNMRTGKRWSHPIDLNRENDFPLGISGGDSKIFYSFHFYDPSISNSNMRYYWFDVETGEKGLVDDFGYGFEGFAASGDWMLRTGDFSDGWNNMIAGYNVVTGDTLQLISANSLFGPAIDGNTLAYVSDSWGTTDLVVYSAGEDGLFGSSDDISAILVSGTTFQHGSPCSIDGRYIVWQNMESPAEDNYNIRAYDMGPDELYATSDDGGFFNVCTNAYYQGNPKISDGIIIWEDWRNADSYHADGQRDVYGFELNTETEFRVTPNPDQFLLSGFQGRTIIINKADWDDEAGNNGDLFTIDISGRMLGKYYKVEITDRLYATATSLLTGTIDTYAFHDSIHSVTLGETAALFWDKNTNGNVTIIAYSAVTGTWQDWSWTPLGDISIKTGAYDALILRKDFDGTRHIQGYSSLTNDVTGVDNLPSSPAGFRIGKNIGMIWADNTAHDNWVKIYNKDRDHWDTRNIPDTNLPLYFKDVVLSDSLALIISGQIDAENDSLLMRPQADIYNVRTGLWASQLISTGSFDIYQMSSDIYFKVKEDIAIVSQDLHNVWYNQTWVFTTKSTDWLDKPLMIGPVLEPPVIGDNFILQGSYDSQNWIGNIYDKDMEKWLPEAIVAPYGITDLVVSGGLVVAWNALNKKVWTYQAGVGNVLTSSIPQDEELIKVATGTDVVYMITKNIYTSRHTVRIFNSKYGEWLEPTSFDNDFYYDIPFKAVGHTAVFISRYGGLWYAWGYSTFQDQWHKIEIDPLTSIDVSDFCGLVEWETENYAQRNFQVYNAIDGQWSDAKLQIHSQIDYELRLDDRLVVVVEKPLSTPMNVYLYSPFYDSWRSSTYTHSTPLEGFETTPTAAMVWQQDEFKIIFNNQLNWTSILGETQELIVTDYATTLFIQQGSGLNSYHFYPPKDEIVDTFGFLDEPEVDLLNSYRASISWRTNRDSDTRLAWGLDQSIENVQVDTVIDSRDHTMLIEGLEAQTTYYYQVTAVTADDDTLASDILSFVVNIDNDVPVLTTTPTPYRIHNDAASVWWTTDEPATTLMQWGLTENYTDSTSEITNSLYHSVRMYDLLPDTTIHFRVGGYDRYGNGPFYSPDYTFRTSNTLPRPSNITALDSGIWGCSYFTWDPPYLDSVMTKERFDAGIPVDWMIRNKGDNARGNSWASGYLGGNAVAYCSFGGLEEAQEEWLITNPVTIGSQNGGVLNFWHFGMYNDYDNAPNRVLWSTSGTDPEDFTEIWSSRDLPDDWELVQIDLDWYNNYGKTVYFAFVYASTNGEIWLLDDVYMDNSVDYFYQNFDGSSNDIWAQWGAYPVGHRWSAGYGEAWCRGYETLPDNSYDMDDWLISPKITITESHHTINFWQIGFYQVYDNIPNEVRVVYNVDNLEDSDLLYSIYTVPVDWKYTSIDLSGYIGKTIKLGWRYRSFVGVDYEMNAWFGEDWHIDEVVLAQNPPSTSMLENYTYHDSKLKRSSSPGSQDISIDLQGWASGTSEKFTLQKLNASPRSASTVSSHVKSLARFTLPEVTGGQSPSDFGIELPELVAYEVFGKYLWEDHFTSLGLVTTPVFIDEETFNGSRREYRVEAVYQEDQSQPSAARLLTGGIALEPGEIAFDSGVLGNAFWWYPGNSFANEFYFPDSLFQLEKIKVHIEEPGWFSLRVDKIMDGVGLELQHEWNLNTTSRGWYEFNVSGIEPANDLLIEFAPLDTIVQLSYDPYDSGASWSYSDDQWAIVSYTPFIRVIGEVLAPVGSNDNNLPDHFALGVNYPNPFNPSTTIPYQLPESANVSIKIYDIKGALVATLIDQEQAPGFYSTHWNATDHGGKMISSGIYFVRIEAGNFTDNQKIIHLK